MSSDELQTHAVGWKWATLTVRWVLGLIFLMAGWWKCFSLTPLGHAQRFFLDSFKDTWIPEWLLYAFGLSIPVIELLAGALICLGFRKREAYIALGAILVVVTYGHLLLEPLFSTTGHIFPRLVLLVFVWVAPPQYDVFSVDWWLDRRRRPPSSP
ncbi:MAG: DoxX family membrane protein [Planctomycetota bacterium]|nr:DoxX family membrane protein [Planctomycetota bacterium]